MHRVNSHSCYRHVCCDVSGRSGHPLRHSKRVHRSADPGGSKISTPTAVPHQRARFRWAMAPLAGLGTHSGPHRWIPIRGALGDRVHITGPGSSERKRTHSGPTTRFSWATAHVKGPQLRAPIGGFRSRGLWEGSSQLDRFPSGAGIPARLRSWSAHSVCCL